jgi:putative oxidoreductase
LLGAAELAGGLGVILGVLAQLAAIGLILIMLGAIQRKIFVWLLHVEQRPSNKEISL